MHHAQGISCIPFEGLPLCVPDRKEGEPEQVVPGAFFVGEENRLAVVAIQSILGSVRAPYRSVVFVGATGTGKTHLAEGLVADARWNDPPGAVRSLSAAEFSRWIADARETRCIDEARERLCQSRLLVIEQIERLAKRAGAQQELAWLMDRGGSGGPCVVLTSGMAPERTLLSAHLRSRLVQGLVVPLEAPGETARTAILRSLARGLELRCDGGLVEALARAWSGTVPCLFQRLLDWVRWCRRRGAAPGVDALDQFLTAHAQQAVPTLAEITRVTAAHFSLSVAQLRGGSRRQSVSTARSVAMYVGRSLTDLSLSEIGAYFGRRDHSTVAHACRMAESRRRGSPEIERAVDEIQSALTRSAEMT